MGKERLQDKINILLDMDEKQFQKELDKKKLAEFRNEALLEFRKNSNKEHTTHKFVRFSTIKVAASIILLTALSVFLYYISQNRGTDYSDLAFYTQKNQISTETSLILADGSEVEIGSNKSMLVYDKLGERIEIDSTKTINLNIKKTQSANEKVFHKLVVPYGKQSKIELSDGSIVWLNAGSQLMYPPEFDDDKREVFLSGEAYFEIAKNENKPFVVQTSGMHVDVLGTAFNVIAYPDDPNIETILVRGSVEINVLGSGFFRKGSYVLIPGQLASYSKKTKTINTQDVDVDSYVSWMKGYFICKKIPLSKLVMKLSRFYNVEIEIDDESIKTSTFSGKLENMANIFNVLDVISETTPMQYKESGNKIIISSIK